MLTPYSKIPQAGQRDWADSLTTLFRNLITAVILLALVDLALVIAVIALAVR